MIDTGILILVACILLGGLVWSIVAELTGSSVSILVVMGAGAVLLSTFHLSYALAFIGPMLLTMCIGIVGGVRKVRMIPDEHRSEVLNYISDNPECVGAMMSMPRREFKELLIMSDSPEEIYYKLHNYDTDAN